MRLTLDPAAQCRSAAVTQIRNQGSFRNRVGYDALGSVGGCGCAQVGDVVTERAVRLVSDGTDDRRRAGHDGAAQRFVGERQEILDASAAASEDDDVDYRVGVEFLQRFDHLGNSSRALNRGVTHCDGNCWPTTMGD